MPPAVRQSVRWLSFASSGLTAYQPVSRHVTRSLWTCEACRSKSRDVQARSKQKWSSERRFTLSALLRNSASEKDVNSVSSPILDHVRSSTRASQLPSQKAKERWEVSEQMTRIVDRVLSRASIAGQHINAYTGTDYSGIDALRKEILQQEQRVKECHTAVTEAKKRHHTETVAQSGQQKEIVSLLERKSSWLPADLERYMALVRSEHINDQTVQEARARLEKSERDLDAARGLLEKLERQQYHEEQIWSDTIRRNSTWITFGLMGVNIVLLLAQILVFEPYRRKRIVRDMKQALDERTLPTLANVSPASEEAVLDNAQIAFNLEAAKGQDSVGEGHTQSPVADIVASGDLSLAPNTVLPEEAVYLSETAEPNSSQRCTLMPILSRQDQTYRQAFEELFSDRRIEARQVEITALIMRSVVAGAATMGLILALWRGVS